MSDAARLADPIAALESLPRGAALILRHYGQPGRAEMARRLVRAARPLGVRIFIAGDWRLAIRTGAAGIAGIGGIAGPGAETGARKVMARRGRLV